MRRRHSIGVGVLILLVGLLAFAAFSQSEDGPYYVVDPTLAVATGHVYPTIPAALARLAALGREAWGATLIIYPGQYEVSGTLVLDIRGLRVVSRDGAGKTQLVIKPGYPAGAPMLVISAPYVTVEGLKIVGTGGIGSNGISVAAHDCQLMDIVVESNSGCGIQGFMADRLSIMKAEVLNNNTDGINLVSSYGIVLSECEVNANGANGIKLDRCDQARLSGNKIVHNGSAGISVINCRNVEIGANTMIAKNGTLGIELQDCARCYIISNNLEANTGAGVALAGCTGTTVLRNSLRYNTGGGISVTHSAASPATSNVIQENSVEAQAGVPGTAPPVVPGISLTGNVRCTQVFENNLTKNAYGIVLLTAAGMAPGGNTIAGNTISGSTQQGVRVADSSGNNIFQNNDISNSNLEGIIVSGGGNDVFQSNYVSGNGTNGITIDGNVEGVIIKENSILNNGAHGIELLNGAIKTSVIGNTVEDCVGIGINVRDGSHYLRLAGNEIFHQEASGVCIEKSNSVILEYNNIHDNHGQGILIDNVQNLTISRGNSISMNYQGGILIRGNSTGYVRGNSIFDNLGYGASLVTPGVSVGLNWWGNSAGPSGVCVGAGNAVLGLDNPILVSPLLPAPAYGKAGSVETPILDLTQAQVAFVSSFAAKKVTVNRLDTAHLRLTFTDVSDRESGWVNTVPFVAEALVAQTGPFTQVEKLISASAVLINGVSNGVVEIAFGYDPAVLPDGTDEQNLTLYVYQDGIWEFSDTGEWTLEGGHWKAISGCATLGSKVVVGELLVSDLLGRTNIIALVLKEEG